MATTWGPWIQGDDFEILVQKSTGLHSATGVVDNPPYELTTTMDHLQNRLWDYVELAPDGGSDYGFGGGTGPFDTTVIANANLTQARMLFDAKPYIDQYSVNGFYVDSDEIQYESTNGQWLGWQYTNGSKRIDWTTSKNVQVKVYSTVQGNMVLRFLRYLPYSAYGTVLGTEVVLDVDLGVDMNPQMDSVDWANLHFEMSPFGRENRVILYFEPILPTYTFASTMPPGSGSDWQYGLGIVADFTSGTMPITFRPPRYRLPGDVPTSAVFSKLRLNQRNDGQGIVANPRLTSSVGGSTAAGDPRNVRVGNRNRLDGAYVQVEGGST